MSQWKQLEAAILVLKWLNKFTFSEVLEGKTMIKPSVLCKDLLEAGSVYKVRCILGNPGQGLALHPGFVMSATPDMRSLGTLTGSRLSPHGCNSPRTANIGPRPSPHKPGGGGQRGASSEKDVGNDWF